MEMIREQLWSNGVRSDGAWSGQVFPAYATDGIVGRAIFGAVRWKWRQKRRAASYIEYR